MTNAREAATAVVGLAVKPILYGAGRAVVAVQQKLVTQSAARLKLAEVLEAKAEGARQEVLKLAEQSAARLKAAEALAAQAEATGQEIIKAAGRAGGKKLGAVKAKGQRVKQAAASNTQQIARNAARVRDDLIADAQQEIAKGSSRRWPRRLVVLGAAVVLGVVVRRATRPQAAPAAEEQPTEGGNGYDSSYDDLPTNGSTYEELFEKLDGAVEISPAAAQ
jgi:hypothetical protein